MIAQVFIGFAQGCCQICTVRYSELWFDVRGRVVSTMLTNICAFICRFCEFHLLTMPLANPLGGAIGSLVLPSAPSVKWAVCIYNRELVHLLINS